MTVALQWHVQSNRNDSIALSTQRSSKDAEEGRNDVLIVLCDARQNDADNPALAASTAQSLFDAVSYASNASDPAQRMSRCVAQIMQQFKRGIVPSQGSGTNITDVRILAALLTDNRLTIGRSHGGSVYLLRGGQLQHLTEEFTNDSDCDIGQVDLEGEDRVMFCSDAISEGLTSSFIRNILRSQPSARKALNLIFRETGAEHLPLSASAAVLDYISGESGSFTANVMTGANEDDGADAPITQRALRSVPALLAVGVVLVAGALLLPRLFGAGDPQPVVAGQQSDTPTPTSAASAVDASPTVVILPVLEATTPPTETPQPVIAPVEPAAPDPTATPEPTSASSATPEPTATNVSSTATVLPPTETALPPTAVRRRPTRRPPTLIPLVTETPIPRPTAEIILPTPTPQPGGGDNGGGGGGGGGSVPCLPGAQCGP
jgi:hypothetical protein